MSDKFWAQIEQLSLLPPFFGRANATVLAEGAILANPGDYGLTEDDVAVSAHRAYPCIRANSSVAEPKSPGVTALVHQWCLDNPTATREEAYLAFPDANPNTVRVQHGKARKKTAG